MNQKVNNKVDQQKINGLKLTQFPVNSNIATTGHELQYQTKHHLIITSWNYVLKNWVYVVLSRVNTLNGLVLTNKLDEDSAKLRISDDLVSDDKRLDALDKEFCGDISWDQTKFVLVLINNVVKK